MRFESGPGAGRGLDLFVVIAGEFLTRACLDVVVRANIR